MSAFQQLVAPRLWTVDYPGFCHRFSRHFFNAPWGYSSAWEAWEATEYKHGPEEPLPTDAAVLLWYSHLGTYGDPPRYDNWGHVTPHVPGVGIYSSPSTKLGSPAGQEIYETIAQVERRFSATYVGWSEDINGLRVAWPAALQHREEEDIMATYLRATGNSSPIDAKNPGTSRIWAGDNREIGGVLYSGVWERSEDGSVRRLFPGEWAAIQEAYKAAGRAVPVADISGNELEKMYLVTRAAPKAVK